MNTTRNENRDGKRVRCHSGFERRSLNFLQTSFFARRRTRDKEGTPDRQIEIWNSYPRRRWQISFSMARGKFVERSLTAYCERGKKREREREREKCQRQGNVQRSFVLPVTRSKSFMRARPNPFDFLFSTYQLASHRGFPPHFPPPRLISLSTTPFSDYHIYERLVSLLLRGSPRKIVFARRAGVV